MSTREQLEANRPGNPPIAGENTSDVFLEIPSCTIEDIDRALFNLFDKDLPLIYSYKKKSQRVPIVFAGGERFAVVARKKPLRDANGAAILPVVSIMRSNLTQANEMGLASNTATPHIIKKQISKKDPRYQRLINRLGLKNSDDLVTQDAFLNANQGTPLEGAKPGRIASRRGGASKNARVRSGDLLSPSLSNNIFEIIEMPPPNFVTATYEVTIWAQYVQQMNNLVMAIMTNTQSHAQRTFRLETQKGYVFVAYMESGFSPGNNFDDFTDDERIIRTSFTLTVPGYLLGETYPGAPNRLRSILSAPQVSFELDLTSAHILSDVEVGTFSGDPNSYVLDDVRRIDAPLPGGAVADQKSVTYNDPRRLNAPSPDRNDSAMLGGAVNDIRQRTVETISDPFGKTTQTISVVKTRSTRNGETVYREVL